MHGLCLRSARMGSEERFDYWRRTIGLVAAPVVFVVFWALPVAGLSVEAHRLLAVLGAVVVLWMTESIPLAVTALLGPALCVCCWASVLPRKSFAFLPIRSFSFFLAAF